MLDPSSRKLIVASLLRLHLAERLGRDPVGEHDAAELAARLGDPRAPGWTFDPPYPGVTSGPEPVVGGTRLVLACRAGQDGEAVAVVITTLVPGRPATVTAAPASTPLPRPGGPQRTRGASSGTSRCSANGTDSTLL